MRITRQLLKKCAHLPLEDVEYINLSDKEIVAIERLELCEQLQTLVLSNNLVDSVRNLYCCRQLWSINLSGNKVKSLSGLSRFPVLGKLNLACNELDWKELKHLSHMTIISLVLLGNSTLESDPHYREHVVDTLTHVWMLDGRIITAEEKKKVSQFFDQSQLSAQPIRHKAAESVFVPSLMKNLFVTGVFGEKTTHLMSKFPVNYTHNTEMDQRRITYLAYTVFNELQLLQRHTRNCPLLPNLEVLMEERKEETEQCNMLLLLLIAGLEYNLPVSLMRATLETAKLNFIGSFNCLDLFSLPAHMILDYASLLLSAAAVDREEKKREGSLYLELYKSLCVAMESVQKKLGPRETHSSQNTPRSPSKEKDSIFRLQCHCLLASEVIHLMCLVPAFFEVMESSEGVMRMIAIATKTPNVSDIIGSIAWKVQSRGGDIWDVYNDVASYLLEATSANVRRKRKIRNYQNVHRTTSQLLQSTQPKSPGRALRALSAGAVSRRLRTRMSPRSATYTRSHREPELGDLVLVSDNQAARIVALPESGVAVLQMNSKAVLSCPPDSYFYTDTNGLMWDRQLGCWTKDNLAADLSRSRLTPSPPLLDHSTITLPSSSSLDSIEYNLRTEVSDVSSYYNPASYGRPMSQMSYKSEDLKTIPSEDELDESADEEEPTTMRVDVATSGTALPGSPTAEHRKQLLQQYSTHSLTFTTPEQSQEPEQHTQQTNPGIIQNKQVPGSHRDILDTAPPKIQLVNTWEADKSLPDISQSSRPHSCRRQDSLKESARVQPHMSPMTSYTSTKPFEHNGTRSVERARHQLTVKYDAWTTAKTNVSVKNTLTSSARLMTKRPPKTPPGTRKLKTLSPSSGYSRPVSRDSSRSSIIRSQHISGRPAPTSPVHLQSYQSHAQKSVGKFHYQPSKNRATSNTRKLGDIRTLYIGGTSIG